MSVLRKSKGNLLIALLVFLLGLAIFVAGAFMGPGGVLKSNSTSLGTITYWGLAFGKDLNLSNMGGSFKGLSINIIYLIAYIGPLVGSFLALLLRRFRFINLICFLAFFFSLCFPFVKLLADGYSLGLSIQNILKSFDEIFYIFIIAQCCGSVLALVNLELCR